MPRTVVVSSWDGASERDPFGDARFCEARFDRSYDDQTASWVATPGGWVCSFDRAFLAAAVRAVLDRELVF